MAVLKKNSATTKKSEYLAEREELLFSPLLPAHRAHVMAGTRGGTRRDLAPLVAAPGWTSSGLPAWSWSELDTRQRLDKRIPCRGLQLHGCTQHDAMQILTAHPLGLRDPGATTQRQS